MSDQESDGLASLGQWRTFLAVHRAGSLTGAARSLGIAQSSITAHLQALEAALGRRLFERSARGVVPTPEADEIAGRLAGPLDAVAEVVATAVDPGGSGRSRAPVRLGGPAEFLAEVAMPALGPLVAGGLRLVVQPGLTDELLADLRRARFDLVVSTRRPRGRTLVAEPLADEEFLLVAAPGLTIDRGRLAREGAVALDRVPLVAYAMDVPLLRRYWRHVLGVRLTSEPALVAPDLRAVRAAVVAGAGVSVLPRYLCEADLETGRLELLLEPEDAPLNTTFLVARAGSVTLPRLQPVIQALREGTARWR